MYQTVTEQAIAEMVDSFYGKIRDDRVLGPIFEDALANDWGPHLKKMKAFWSTVLLASRTYKGNPMIAHLLLPRLTQGHFDRWLELWRQTAAQLCSEDLARTFIKKAETIGERLLQTITMYHEAQGAQQVA